MFRAGFRAVTSLATYHVPYSVKSEAQHCAWNIQSLHTFRVLYQRRQEQKAEDGKTTADRQRTVPECTLAVLADGEGNSSSHQSMRFDSHHLLYAEYH